MAKFFKNLAGALGAPEPDDDQKRREEFVRKSKGLPKGFFYCEEPLEEPYVSQWKIIEDRVSKEVLYGGAPGSGKSKTAMWKIIQWCVTMEGLDCAVVRQTVKSAKSTFFDKLVSMCEAVSRKYGLGLRVKRSANEAGIYWDNGSHVVLKSGLDPHSVQGGDHDLVVIEEAVELNEETLRMIGRALRGSDEGRKRGYPVQVLMTSNPRPGSFLKREFVDKWKLGLLEGWRRYEKASTYENKRLLEHDPTYCARVIAMYGAENGKRLLEGDWNFRTDTVYRYLEGDLSKKVEERDLISWEEFLEVYGGWSGVGVAYLAMDHGVRDAMSVGIYVLKSEGDKTVVVRVGEWYEGLNGRNERVVVDWARGQVPAGVELMGIGVNDLNVSTQRGKAIVSAKDEFGRAGLGIVMVDKNRQMGYNCVVQVLAERKLKIVVEKCPKLLDEWEGYLQAGENGAKGEEWWLAPKDSKNDHAMDELRYGMVGLWGQLGMTGVSEVGRDDVKKKERDVLSSLKSKGWDGDWEEPKPSREKRSWLKVPGFLRGGR